MLAKQVWPVFGAQVSTATPVKPARSASSSTIAADLPPSSRVRGRSSRPQSSAISRPTAVEPVKATLSMPWWRTRCRPVSGPPVTMFTTPGGMPASSIASAST